MTPTVDRAPAAVSEGGDDNGSRFRVDIEGLRAVAVGLVLLYHAGVRQMPGGFVGVDVFFVISGFLITGLLVRELETSGRVSLTRFYARRAKRLLPATAAVLVATAVLTWCFLPVTDRSTLAGDIVAAALYVVNWRLASRSVDYLAEGVGPSPVLHFWSLAVEEQFYVVWPLLLVAVAWGVRRRGGDIRARMAVGIAMVAVPSLVWSVHLTSRDSATAFFITTTRLWELAVGAAAAIGAQHWKRLHRGPAIVIGWLGLAAIAASGALFDASARWPGYRALLPTLGTAAVIVAGFSAGGGGAARLLSWRPMVWVGGLSYSLYLWHWPLLVAATAHWGKLGALRGLGVVAISLLPAWLSHRFVENPIRFSRRVGRSSRFALSLGLGFTLTGAAAGLALWCAVPGHPPSRQPLALGARALGSNPGATASAAPRDHSDTIVPDPMQAPKDIPKAYAEGCQVGYGADTPVECIAGDPKGAIDIVLAGDSKIMQWYSAFDELGKENGWRIRTRAKSECAFSATVDARAGHPDLSCLHWNEKVLVQLLADPPDLVVTSQRQAQGYEEPTQASSPQTKEAMSAGLAKRWGQLEARGIHVAVLLDNPGPAVNVYECVAKNRERLSACAFSRQEGIDRSAAPTQLAAASAIPSVTVVDLTPGICPTEKCEPVIGGVLVYRQGSHLTDTYVRTLAPRLHAALAPLLASKTK